MPVQLQGIPAERNKILDAPHEGAILHGQLFFLNAHFKKNFEMKPF